MEKLGFLTVVLLRINIFWDATLCCWGNDSQCWQNL